MRAVASRLHRQLIVPVPLNPPSLSSICCQLEVAGQHSIKETLFLANFQRPPGSCDTQLTSSRWFSTRHTGHTTTLQPPNQLRNCRLTRPSALDSSSSGLGPAIAPLRLPSQIRLGDRASLDPITFCTLTRRPHSVSCCILTAARLSLLRSLRYP